MSAPRDDHEAWDELAVGWALHALEPEDEALFTPHLPGCARCARTVAETSEVMAALANDLPPAEPSEGLRDRLRDAVERTEQVPPPPSAAGAPDAGLSGAATGPVNGPGSGPAAGPRQVPGPPGGRRRTDVPGGGGSTRATGFPSYVPAPAGEERPERTAWRRVLPNALVAAAVAAILALGTWNVVLSSARDEAQAAAAEQADVVQSLLQPGRATIAPVTDDDGHDVATVVARDGELQVVTHGLRLNDRDATTYVVWGMTETDPVPLGTFDVVSPQTDLRAVGSASTGLDDYEAYAVSIEPGRQAPSEPTDVVASGQVSS
ncbi:anti-sigma factor domain-containing protein [Geodermatophilus nigrescens]|uniref:Regulator of SigK n=1 Tax=Geodermatophilus nigrescens TaxID=1070870 RepID=A0A1M5RU38_9ACTN|nr:anti-sigma factor [Geodermatophilus nigrescens]SHH29746.1 Anti-sigma-K factor rskA [Geodermatophilus nigrescens]